MLKSGYVYSTNKKGASVDILPDTGAQVNLISQSLCDLLALQETPMTKKVRLGSVKEENAMTLTHQVTIKHRVGQQQYHATFMVAPLVGTPDMILGIPWMKDNCPEILEAFSHLGKTPKREKSEDVNNIQSHSEE